MEIKAELLLGKQVRSISDKRVGRIEEIRAELRQGECFVTEYLIGTYAVFERLASLAIVRALLGLVAHSIKTGYRVPWDRMDLSNPRKPRLKCRVSQLRRLD